MNLNDIDAIIFDLGGVILNIDYTKTSDEFKKLGCTNFDELYSQASQKGLFDDFETGKISTPAFINQLLDFLPPNTTANQVVAAWNAMLLDFPNENLSFLEQIKEKKNTYLLSNTNEIHIKAFNRKLEQQVGKQSLHSYFINTYFSNEIGLRKPHPETFEYVCKQNSLIPNRTLFIDDSIQHIEGAKKIGLQTLHLAKNDSILNHFNIY